VRFFGFFKGIPIDNLFTIQKSFKAHVKMWEMVLRLSTNFCVAVILESGTKFISQVLFKLKAQSMYTMLVLCWHLLKIFRKWHIPKFSPNHSFGCLKNSCGFPMVWWVVFFSLDVVSWFFNSF